MFGRKKKKQTPALFGSRIEPLRREPKSEQKLGQYSAEEFKL